MEAWDLQFECECITKTVSRCTSMCCQPVTKVLGVVMVLGGRSHAAALAEPVALTPTWDLKIGAPLKSPAYTHKESLPAIFSGVLKNTDCWFRIWLSQILSAASYMQVALLSNFRGAVMRALHSAIARAYSGSPQSTQATTKVLHHLSYHMPAHRCVLAARVATWVEKHAYWVGNSYSSWRLPDQLTLEGICGA